MKKNYTIVCDATFMISIKRPKAVELCTMKLAAGAVLCIQKGRTLILLRRSTGPGVIIVMPWWQASDVWTIRLLSIMSS